VAVLTGILKLVKDRKKRLGLVVLVTRLVYTAFLLGATGFLYGALDPNQAVAMEAMFTKVWYAGLVIFGIHLLALSAASIKNPDFPGIFTPILAIAGLGYGVIHAFYVLSQVPGDWFDRIADRLQGILGVPMALAEIGLAVWLLVVAYRGKKNSANSLLYSTQGLGGHS